MKNSRSGNQLRKRARTPPTVIVLKWTPCFPTQALHRANPARRPESNQKINLRGELNAKRDEL